MRSLTRKAVLPLIRLALREDSASRDLTSLALFPAQTRIRARLVAKERGFLAGAPVAAWIFHAVDPSLRCTLKCHDGALLTKGKTILVVVGNARSILAAERVALNMLGHLCGIATLTRQFVQQTRGTRAKIFDTRKTLPGLRMLEKYAVRIGGGHNHRMGLRDAILIKTNHLRALGRREFGVWSSEFGMVVQSAIKRAKGLRPKKFVEVEVATLKEYKAALVARPDAILLDNWSLQQIRKAVLLRNSVLRTPHSALILEVSGGVTLANVRAIARTGVERISIGRLTHSAPALNVSLKVV